MQDGIIKGTGNSRYLKSISSFLTQYPTYQDFVAALVAGTLPIDLNGINETGWDQLGTALNKANLLSDETAEMAVEPSVETMASSLTTTQFIKQVIYGSGKFIASVSAAGLIYSEDGGTWAQCSGVPTNANISAFATNGTRTLAGTYNAVYYTDDGINWTQAAAPPLSSFSISAMGYGNGMFVAAATTNPASMIYSENGVNWYLGTGSGFPPKIDSIAYGAGTFVAVTYIAGSSTFAYSTDGVNWTNRARPSQNGSDSIAFANGMFLYKEHNQPRVWKSADGVDWESISIPYSMDLPDVLACGNHFFLYGKEDALITSDLTIWKPVEYALTLDTPVAAYGNGGVLLLGITNDGTLQFVVFSSADADTPDKLFQSLLARMANVEAAIISLSSGN